MNTQCIYWHRNVARNESFDFKIAVENARKIAHDTKCTQAPVEIHSYGRDYFHKGQKITINLPNGQTARKKRTVNGDFKH